MNARQRHPTHSRHVCWSYDDPAVFQRRAHRFIANGLAGGEQVWFVGSGQPETLTGPLREVPRFRAALDSGALRVTSVQSAYSMTDVIDPLAQTRAWASATDASLADGFTGLRVVADATALVRTPAQLDAFARYEYLVDRYMRHRPMSAVCAYDRRELGDRAVAELACMHPASDAADLLFHLYTGPSDEAPMALAGELDPSNHDVFRLALERADPPAADGRVVIDGTDLTFVDHRALIHLDEYADRHGITVTLRSSRSAAARLVGLLDLSRVTVEAAR